MRWLVVLFLLAGSSTHLFSQVNIDAFATSSIVQDIKTNSQLRIALLEQDAETLLQAKESQGLNKADFNLVGRVAEALGNEVKLNIKTAENAKKLFFLLSSGRVDMLIYSIGQETEVPDAILASQAYMQHRTAMLSKYHNRTPSFSDEPRIIACLGVGLYEAISQHSTENNVISLHALKDFTVQLEERYIDQFYLNESELDILIQEEPEILLYYKPFVLHASLVFQRHLLVRNRELLLIINSVIQKTQLWLSGEVSKVSSG